MNKIQDNRKQRLIGKYCREYRERKKLKINDIRGDINYQTINSFEKGSSSNIHILSIYLKIAKENRELNRFMEKIGEILCN